MNALVRLVGHYANYSDDHDAINAVSELIAEAGIGKRLGDVGATSAHYGAWAQAAQEDICLRSNPRTASLEQIVGFVRSGAINAGGCDACRALIPGLRDCG